MNALLQKIQIPSL